MTSLERLQEEVSKLWMELRVSNGEWGRACDNSVCVTVWRSVSVCGRERVVFIKLLSVCQVFPTECDFFSNWNVKGHS